MHDYGPHYFRTNSQRVVDYLSKFTDWQPVEYKILSWTHDRFWQFPINLNTFEQFIGRSSTSEEMEAQLAKWRVKIDNPRNSEEVIVSQVGWELYEMFFKNYTRKQWQRDAKDLDPSVCGRIPIRTNRDDRYLSEKFQALPRDGYTKMFERMLDNSKIDIRLNTDFRDMREQVQFEHLIFTGPIDEYYDHFQPAMQVNYPNDHDFTRIVEIKHATGQKIGSTTIVREYPQDFGPDREPYYPIPAPDAKALYSKYAERAAAEKNVSFVGRLATYRYYNMDQVVGMALAEFERLQVPRHG